jgi:hypothetical protein
MGETFDTKQSRPRAPRATPDARAARSTDRFSLGHAEAASNVREGEGEGKTVRACPRSQARGGVNPLPEDRREALGCHEISDTTTHSQEDSLPRRSLLPSSLSLPSVRPIFSSTDLHWATLAPHGVRVGSRNFAAWPARCVHRVARIALHSSRLRSSVSSGGISRCRLSKLQWL